MKYIFFGTPEFAAVILEKLIAAGYPPQALVCNPDRPVGRKKIITPPPTKKVIREKGLEKDIKILQPEDLSPSAPVLSSLRPEFGVVAAYAKIIPKGIIKIFPRGIIGVHPSLLPKHRGSSPIQSAILDGDKEIGVTLYLLDEKMDNGPILAQRKLENFIETPQFSILLKQLAMLGGDLLLEALPGFVRGDIKPQPQNKSEATYTKKFVSEDGFISKSDLDDALGGADPQKAIEIERKIKALNPEPGTWTTGKNGKRIKILEAATLNGRLVLKKIQEEGKKPKSI